MKILFLSKKTNICRNMQQYIKKRLTDVDVIEGEYGDPYPVIEKNYDYIISFLCPWILKKKSLKKAKIAINFHPAPPAYPGIGGYNFAIYNKDNTYGVTCHEMMPMVDSGNIIQVIEFNISLSESVQSLKNKSMEHLTNLFQNIV